LTSVRRRTSITPYTTHRTGNSMVLLRVCF
jgi:hypothetical protein